MLRSVRHIATTAVRRAAIPPGYVENLSKGAMLRFQDSLPKLPVPTLVETCDKYLRSVQPLTTETEFERTKGAVEAFLAQDSLAHTLQTRLLEKSQDPHVTNWLYDWWNDAAYLCYRGPVVPYVSYFYSYKNDPARTDPAKRAAAVVSAALTFKHEVDTKSLEPDYMKGLPMCMDSFKYMFNVCRMPAEGRDYPKSYSPAEHKYFVAIRKNRFYKVYHEVDGKVLTTGELEAAFRKVYAAADAQPAAPGLGLLTSEHRDKWTAFRKDVLAADSGNEKSLDAIQASSFVVCLDDAAPVTPEEKAHQYWHGDGANRWFDKPLQFIINDNGAAGFMGEHSMMDGTPTHRINDYICDVITNNKIELSETVRDEVVAGSQPEELPIVYSDKVVADIEESFVDFENEIRLHDLKVFDYQTYGKNQIKKFKVSPDAYIQMMIQLAYFKMYGKSNPTYESATTRRFQQGRTETCRSVSNESVAFVKTMTDANASNEAKYEAALAAMKAHGKYIADASAGKGVDRHLFGLRKLIKEGEKTPELYTDPAYTYSSTWYLSTSQLSSAYFDGYGWSQVTDTGYGLAYMINPDSLHVNIVSKKLGVEKMAEKLTEAADEMFLVFQSQVGEQPKL